MKKKILFITLASIFILLISCVTVNAITYDVKIDDTYVTDSNKNDVLGDGVYTYNSSTNTLTVNKQPSDPELIISDMDGNFTLYIPKDVSLYNITLDGNSTITGEGTLNAKSIYPSGRLLIKDTRIIANEIGTKDKVYGDLLIENSYVKAKIGYFSGIDYYDCDIVYPSDYSVTYQEKTIRNELKQFDTITNSYGSSDQNTIIAPLGEYGLIVAGTTVTSSNKNDVFGNGEFSYNSATKTLTLSKSYFCSYQGVSIYSTVDELTIDIPDSVSLYNNTSHIKLYGDTEITGGGHLNLGQTSYPAIELFYGADLYINDVTISSTDKAKSYAIKGNGYGSEVIIDNADLYLDSIEAAVTGIDDISLFDAVISVPQNGYVQNGNFYDADGNIANHVRIRKAEKYDLHIAGTQVTSANCDKITGDISYNPDEKTLYLKSDINYTASTTLIDSEIDGLTIAVEGDRILSGGLSNKPAIILNGDTVIKGGNLTVTNAGTGIAISVLGNPSIKIKNKSLNVNGGHGFVSYEGGAKLTFDKVYANINASGMTNSVAVYGFTGGITFNGCEIMQPAGASLKNGSIYFNGVPAQNAVIGSGFELYIDDVQVTSFNMDDILENGVFSFDPGTNTLTINGAYESSADSMIYSYLPDELTIYVASNSAMRSPVSFIYADEEDITVTGPGQLYIIAGEIGLEDYKGTIKIKKADIYISSGYGIKGVEAELKIINSDVEINAEYNAFEGFDGIETVHERIIKPENKNLLNTKYAKLTGIYPYSIDNVEFNGAAVDVSVSASEKAPYNAVIMAVCHDSDGKCIKVSSEKINANTKNVTLDIEPYSDEVRIYIWNSMDIMQPIAVSWIDYI